MTGHEREDQVLGAPYRAIPLPIRTDRRGPAAATLVHREGRADLRERPALLMLHGWSDYVFHRPVLEHLHQLGFDVWALDLRRYGRSIRVGDVPTAIDDLADYDEELLASLDRIGTDRPVVILAHSMGGLVAVRFAQRRTGLLAGLILNSPWLEFHLGAAGRRAVLPAVRAAARRLGDAPVLPKGSSAYARIVHEEFDGEPPFDPAWKPDRGQRFPASTFAAVLEAQEQLAAEPELDLPVLTLHSTRSDFVPWFRERMRGEDVVLEVQGMHEAALRLGPRSEVVPLQGAVHDVFLSAPPTRARALQEITRWARRLRTLGLGECR